MIGSVGNESSRFIANLYFLPLLLFPLLLSSVASYYFNLIEHFYIIPFSVFKVFIYFHSSVCICIHACILCPWRPEEAVGSHGARVAGEQLNMGVGNQTWILCKNYRCFIASSLLFCPLSAAFISTVTHFNNHASLQLPLSRPSLHEIKILGLGSGMEKGLKVSHSSKLWWFQGNCR